MYMVTAVGTSSQYKWCMYTAYCCGDFTVYSCGDFTVHMVYMAIAVGDFRVHMVYNVHGNCCGDLLTVQMVYVHSILLWGLHSVLL